MTEIQLTAYRTFFNIMQTKHSIDVPSQLRRLTALQRESEMLIYRKEFEAALSKMSEIREILAPNTVIRDCDFNYRIDDDIQIIGGDIKDKYQELAGKLRDAMFRESVSEIYLLCNALKALLKDQSGKPEVAAIYFNRKGEDVNPSRLYQIYDALAASADYPYIGKYCSGRLPNSEDIEMYLRTGCEMIRSAFAGMDNRNISEEKRELLKSQAKSGLDSLLTVQHPSGVFPFPDMRGINPWFAPMIENMLKGLNERDYIENGWLIKGVKGDGGLQFDNALCGSVLIEGYKRFNDRKYLAAAVAAGEWAMKQEIVVNFNYNAFSVMLLSELFMATGNYDFLDSALKKTRLGIMPGLCDNGRYFDGHNAKTVYHLILIRGMLTVVKALKSIDIVFVDIESALKSAVRGLTDEIINKGANNQSSSIQAMSLYSEIFEINEDIIRAYKLSVNSIFYEIDQDKSRLPAFKDSAGMGLSLSAMPMVIRLEERINEKI